MGKLLIANWKSNPENLAEARKLAKSIDVRQVVVAPPFPFLEAVNSILENASLGAQDVFWSGGPYTGAVSAGQLKKLGVKYVIVGHSERRYHFNESDETVNRKLKAVLGVGMKAVLCVGEGPAYRRNPKAAKKFVRNQILKDLSGIKNWKLKIENLVVAYEPVWAIGTGLADSPEHAAEMAAEIKSVVGKFSSRDDIPVLYGGSVTSKNALRFLSLLEISGALVGGASLNPSEFRKITRLISRAKH